MQLSPFHVHDSSLTWLRFFSSSSSSTEPSTSPATVQYSLFFLHCRQALPLLAFPDHPMKLHLLLGCFPSSLLYLREASAHFHTITTTQIFHFFTTVSIPIPPWQQLTSTNNQSRHPSQFLSTPMALPAPIQASLLSCSCLQFYESRRENRENDGEEAS